MTCSSFAQVVRFSRNLHKRSTKFRSNRSDSCLLALSLIALIRRNRRRLDDRKRIGCLLQCFVQCLIQTVALRTQDGQSCKKSVDLDNFSKAASSPSEHL
jgi:hypothetical protein